MARNIMWKNKTRRGKLTFDTNANTKAVIHCTYHELANNRVDDINLGDIQLETDTYEVVTPPRSEPVFELNKLFFGTASNTIYGVQIEKAKGKPDRLAVTIGRAAYQYKKKAAAQPPPPAKAATAPIRAETLLALERVVSSIMLQ